jgi:hypothetical protein
LHSIDEKEIVQLISLNPKPKKNIICKQTFANNKRTIQQKQKQNPINKPKVK